MEVDPFIHSVFQLRDAPLYEVEGQKKVIKAINVYAADKTCIRQAALSLECLSTQDCAGTTNSF